MTNREKAIVDVAKVYDIHISHVARRVEQGFSRWAQLCYAVDQRELVLDLADALREADECVRQMTLGAVQPE